MKTLARLSTSIAVLAALMGLLAVAPLIAPGPAAARPYVTTNDPGPIAGDPTGDDHPAPTPKPVNKAAAASVRASATKRGAVHPQATAVSGQWILRYLISIALR